MKEVLLVDDELDIQIIVADFLRNHGIKVEGYANGEQALERLSNKKFDLVITDLKMPEEDGYSLIYKLRTTLKNFKTTPIIIITGTISRQDIARLSTDLTRNNIQFLEKPVDFDLLLKMVCYAFGIDIEDVGRLMTA